jgi:hypothetical protein
MEYITGTIMGRLVTLVSGRKQKVQVYAKLIHPEQMLVRNGLVLIELPANCYIQVGE